MKQALSFKDYPVVVGEIRYIIKASGLVQVEPESRSRYMEGRRDYTPHARRLISLSEAPQVVQDIAATIPFLGGNRQKNNKCMHLTCENIILNGQPHHGKRVCASCKKFIGWLSQRDIIDLKGKT